MGHSGVFHQLPGECTFRGTAGQYDVVARVSPPLWKQLTSETRFQIVHRRYYTLEKIFLFSKFHYNCLNWRQQLLVEKKTLNCIIFVLTVSIENMKNKFTFGCGVVTILFNSGKTLRFLKLKGLFKSSVIFFAISSHIHSTYKKQNV